MIVVMYASSLLASKTPDPVYHAPGSGTWKTRCKRRPFSYYPAGYVHISRRYADSFARPCRNCFPEEP